MEQGSSRSYHENATEANGNMHWFYDYETFLLTGHRCSASFMQANQNCKLFGGSLKNNYNGNERNNVKSKAWIKFDIRPHTEIY